MSDKPSGKLKAVLEYGPLLVFFVAFLLLRNETIPLFGQDYSGFIIATLIFIPVLVLATLAQWWLTGRLSPMQIATLVLVVVFGGLSVWLNDPRFFKMKPTIIYLLFGGILGYAYLRRKNWLESVLSEALPMRAEGWRKLTLRMALAFLAMAVANEVVWRTMSETNWVYFKTFGLPLLLFIFLMGNAGLFKEYGIERDK